MSFSSEFIQIPLADAHATAERMREQGARFVQIHAVNGEDGVDLYYTYDQEGTLTNYKVAGLTKDDIIPSVSDVFLAAFVFENEARELFGIDLRDIAIDFGGNMYTLAETEPMTYLSPELAAAKAKARAAALAKAQKTAEKDGGKAAAGAAGAADATAAADAKDAEAEKAAALEAKLASMDPEKAAKFRAAMEAKAAKQKAQEEAEAKAKLEAKLASMDPEKAAKFRAAMEAKAAREAAAAAKDGE